MNTTKLYNVLKHQGIAPVSTKEERKIAICQSYNQLYIPNINEKRFNFERIKSKNKEFNLKKKTDYNFELTRDSESDRMKRMRRNGTKKLRRYLKKETNNIINDSF